MQQLKPRTCRCSSSNERTHIITRSERKGKEKRRELVSQTHDIVLFFGDNLSDFTGFDGKTVKTAIKP